MPSLPKEHAAAVAGTAAAAVAQVLLVDGHSVEVAGLAAVTYPVDLETEKLATAGLRR